MAFFPLKSLNNNNIRAREEDDRRNFDMAWELSMTEYISIAIVLLRKKGGRRERNCQKLKGRQ